MTTQEQSRMKELEAEIARLQAEKEKTSALRFKKTEKGGLSVYGLGRFPVTLYKGQWIRLLDVADQIRAEVKDLPDKKTE